MHITDRSLERRREREVGLVTRRSLLTSGLALSGAALSGCLQHSTGQQNSLDTYRPSDRAFFEPLRLDGAIRAAGGARSLEELVKSSSAVVQSKISRAVIAAVSKEKTETAQISTIGLVLDAPKLLHGKLPAYALNGLTVVGGTATNSVKGEIGSLNSMLPIGELIWILNSITALAEERRQKLEELGREPTREDLQETAAMASLFVAGPHSVITQGDGGLDMPYLINDDFMHGDPLAKDIVRFKSMSAFRSYIKEIR